VIRPEVVELLVSASERSVFPQRLAHADGAPYTREEQALADSATDEEREITRKLIDAHVDHARRQEEDLTVIYDIARAATVPPDDRRAWRTAVETAGQGCPPPSRNLPAAENWLHQNIADTIIAFRAHILQHLNGDHHSRALDCLDRLNPIATTAEEHAELEEYRTSLLRDLWNAVRLIDQYKPDDSTPLPGFWDRIPEVDKDEIRAAFMRCGWTVPDKST
jgi:hypothetical protein